MKLLYTIGYGNDKPEQVIWRLKHYEIDYVIGIRRAGSRSWYGLYSPGNIGKFLIERAGIVTLEFYELGNTFPTLEEYSDWLETKDGEFHVTYMAAQILMQGEKKGCLLCSEFRPVTEKGIRCHRVHVANAVVKKLNESDAAMRKWVVFHILNPCPYCQEREIKKRYGKGKQA